MSRTMSPAPRHRLAACLAAFLVLLLPAATACEETPSERFGPGRWRRFPTNRFDEGLTEEQREAIERLEGLAYLSGSRPPPSFAGVTVHAPERSYGGLNFYVSAHGPAAYLADMEGNVLHRWSKGFEEVWPDHPAAQETGSTRYWRRGYLRSDGDVLAIFEGQALIRLDAESNLEWALLNRAHHDLEITGEGRILALTREARLVPRIHETEPIQEDFISVLDEDGDEQRRISLLEALERSPWFDELEGRIAEGGDIFHTNTVVLLEGRLADRIPEFRAGNVLVSFRNLDTIAVVDMESERIVWALTGPFVGQHDPRVLDDGDLLVFDNWSQRPWSRVIELDPVTREIEWELVGSEEDPFWSDCCGLSQPLPNGNVLITETDAGRAFEVTPARETVWEFYNPHRAWDDGEEFIAALFEMVRLPPDFPTDWIPGGEPATGEPGR